MPFLTWREEEEEEDEVEELLVESEVTKRPVDAAKFLLCEDTDGITQRGEYGATREADQFTLADCFYLGSYDMTGRVVKGQGCIDEPAAHIWRQTQNCSSGDGSIKRRSLQRKNSLPSSLHDYRPKYVRLVACCEDLRIVDNHTEETLVAFNYRRISFTGTHPKYSSLFCFIAWENKQRTPYCHVFKCESAVCATSTSHELSRVFQRMIRELKGSPVPRRPVLRKAFSQI